MISFERILQGKTYIIVEEFIKDCPKYKMPAGSIITKAGVFSSRTTAERAKKVIIDGHKKNEESWYHRGFTDIYIMEITASKLEDTGEKTTDDAFTNYQKDFYNIIKETEK